jgi:hypothetical protein
MKKEKVGGKRSHKTNLVLIFGVIAVIFISIYLSGLLNTKCGRDAACFDKALSKCTSASYTLHASGNVYLYESSSSLGETCKVKVTMIKSVEGSDLQLKEKLEGKEMTCYFPRDRLKKEGLTDMDDFADFCTGPLKEGMLEIVVGKMYGLVVANLGEISLEARKAVTGI